MCGRYELEAAKQELLERYHLEVEVDTDKSMSREEIFPTNTCPVIVPGPELKKIKWGFTESFSDTPLINARGETILQKPTFKNSFIHSRCLIPATAFFEWEKINDKKLRRRISIKDTPIFSLAGITKRYQQEDGSTLEAFSIITTNASEELKHIHDRMPVILNPKDEELYLNDKVTPVELSKLLVPTPLKLIIE